MAADNDKVVNHNQGVLHIPVVQVHMYLITMILYYCIVE